MLFNGIKTKVPEKLAKYRLFPFIWEGRSVIPFGHIHPI